jgi:hypothetical protein
MLFAPIRWGPVPTTACSIGRYPPEVLGALYQRYNTIQYNTIQYKKITLEGCSMASMLYSVTIQYSTRKSRWKVVVWPVCYIVWRKRCTVSKYYVSYVTFKIVCTVEALLLNLLCQQKELWNTEFSSTPLHHGYIREPYGGKLTIRQYSCLGGCSKLSAITLQMARWIQYSWAGANGL